MVYRRFGRTDLRVSALSLGTVALGIPYGIAPQSEHDTNKQAGMPPPPDQEAIQLIHHALDLGINFIDTARAYGRSEELLGQALRDRRDKVVLATKLGCLDSEGELLHGVALRQHMHDSIATSLRLLQTDYVDLLMLHSASADVLENGEAIDILKDFQTQGLTRYIGASTYGTEASRLAIENHVHALQVAYNILDQRMVDEIFPLAQAQGIGVVVRSVFLKGVLTPRVNDLPQRLAQLKLRSEQVKQVAAQLKPPISLLEAALRFVLSSSDVASTLVGVRTKNELQTAVEFAHAGALSAESLSALGQLRWDDEIMLNPGTWGLP